MLSGHLSPAQQLACGLRAPPGDGSTWAAVQAAYRFLNNPRVTLRTLAEPLLDAAHQAVPQQCDRFVLASHDWSLIRFRRHHRKLDRQQVKGKKWKEGYELHSCLLVSDRGGEPIAPVAMSLHAADGAHCSRSAEVRPILSVLDELDPAMSFVERQNFGKPVVHIVDAEADSVAHYRLWSEVPGRTFLVRADDRLVEFRGEEQKISVVRETLQREGCFQYAREVRYRDRPASQWITEVPVCLLRAGQQNRADGSRKRVAGPPLPLRLILSEVNDAKGNVVATWRLLTNAPAEVDATTIALWYYWRWRIETYFKLLKTAGFDLEDWQQESAGALTRRLLVASMACVIVWHLARDQSPEADQTRKLLIQLSGRQMKRSTPFTAPALLSGLWMLLQIQFVLQNYDPSELLRIADLALPQFRAGPASEDV
ncbi:transposase [Bremerella sp. JC770]|uniref:transposase n=1 Tax=Bremerella sp. JC770 TaxID=3232137 RepID=UPI00345A50F0